VELKSRKLTAVTGTDGSGTATDTISIVGFLCGVEWIDGSYDDGVGATLTVINTESTVVATLLTLTNANSDAMYYPTAAEHDATGTATGTRAVPVINGTLKLAVTDGGSAKTGGCIVFYASR
jgi:adenosylcobinamide amidohydrolase